MKTTSRGPTRWSLALATLLLVTTLTAPSIAAVSVNLQWAENTEEDLAGYRVKYWAYGVAGATPIVVDAGNVTQLLVVGLPDGRYYFSGQAYDSLGQDSEWCAPILTPAVPKTMGGLKVMRLELAR